MANDAKIQAAVELMAGATNHRFFGEKEAASTFRIYRDALGAFSNEAVGLAAEEWADTMTKFPTLVEFLTLVRSKQIAVDESNERERAARALEAGVGGPAPDHRRAAVGKPGSEAIAAQIVLQRMVKAVAEISPHGYFGRLAGLSDSTRPGMGLREAGHTFDVFGRHESAGIGPGRCERCQLIATVAFEQAILGPDSTLTWDSWEGPDSPIDLGALRRCANASCDHGWVSVLSIEGGRTVDRLKKCETCGGPQPKVKRPKVMDGEEMITVTRNRRGRR